MGWLVDVILWSWYLTISTCLVNSHLTLSSSQFLFMTSCLSCYPFLPIFICLLLSSPPTLSFLFLVKQTFKTPMVPHESFIFMAANPLLEKKKLPFTLQSPRSYLLLTTLFHQFGSFLIIHSFSYFVFN